MKQTINNSSFHDAFYKMNRGNQFSYQAREALYDYYIELEEETGEETELDIISLCCEWTEYDDNELINEYGYLVDDEEDFEDNDELVAAINEQLQDRTTVLSGNSWVIQNF